MPWGWISCEGLPDLPLDTQVQNSPHVAAVQESALIAAVYLI